MGENTPFDPDHPGVDPGRRQPLNAFDAKDGYSGQEYSEARARDQASAAPAGSVDPRGHSPASDDPTMPPDNGKRASHDPKTGEVHGSGASAGGGHQGEDFDAGGKGGAGYPIHLPGDERVDQK